MTWSSACPSNYFTDQLLGSLSSRSSSGTSGAVTAAAAVPCYAKGLTVERIQQQGLIVDLLEFYLFIAHDSYRHNPNGDAVIGCVWMPITIRPDTASFLLFLCFNLTVFWLQFASLFQLLTINFFFFFTVVVVFEVFFYPKIVFVSSSTHRRCWWLVTGCGDCTAAGGLH